MHIFSFREKNGVFGCSISCYIFLCENGRGFCFCAAAKWQIAKIIYKRDSCGILWRFLVLIVVVTRVVVCLSVLLAANNLCIAYFQAIVTKKTVPQGQRGRALFAKCELRLRSLIIANKFALYSLARTLRRREL